MINFYSTNRHVKDIPLKEAVLRGLASDGGLFMPEIISPLEPAFFAKISSLNFQEICFQVAKHMLQQSIPDGALRTIVEKSMTFDAPLVNLSDEIYVLELFHGPTLSFKDFGARFMAQLMAYFIRGQDQELHILTATSGDTGSAVGYGFLDIPGIKVWILYPQGQVSKIQEKQLTAIGHNVTVLEVDGTFDDCQTLVKRAFNDAEIRHKMPLTSANSINIARLIPQTFYYFYAYAQLHKPFQPIVFSVPSGNFGNLTAGLIAKRMGLPVSRFIAATNINDVIPHYLKSGIFQSQPSKKTISNAMDVGNPSNFARMLDLYDNSLEAMRKDLFGISFTDKQTEEGIRQLNEKYQYISDPHGAVAYLGLKAYQEKNKVPGIFLETAHPAKFLNIVEPIIKKKVEMPERLRQVQDKDKHSIKLSPDYNALKDFLMT
jgi:threonine synthase